MLKTGELTIDRTKVREEAFLDGKYLLTTSDDTLNAADVALGYKQLLQVEGAFRTLKSHLAIRPVSHWKPERIQAHVVLCWLALVLVRVAENRTEQSWAQIRRTLDRPHLVTFQEPHGTVQQRPELTPEQTRLFREVQVEPPPRMHEIIPN